MVESSYNLFISSRATPVQLPRNQTLDSGAALFTREHNKYEEFTIHEYVAGGYVPSIC
jgi:hypothetical protein